MNLPGRHIHAPFLSWYENAAVTVLINFNMPPGLIHGCTARFLFGLPQTTRLPVLSILGDPCICLMRPLHRTAICSSASFYLHYIKWSGHILTFWEIFCTFWTQSRSNRVYKQMSKQRPASLRQIRSAADATTNRNNVSCQAVSLHSRIDALRRLFVLFRSSFCAFFLFLSSFFLFYWLNYTIFSIYLQ